MKPLIAALLAVSAFAQTSPYPTTLDSTATLGVPADNVFSALTAPMLIGATTATVANATNIPQWALITFGSELMQVCSKSGNTLSFGTSSACPSIAGRGLSSTTVAAHASGVVGYMYTNAYYQKAMASAVIAIESSVPTALNAASMSGSDIGAKVNAAIATFSGTTCGAIFIPPGTYSYSTRIATGSHLGCVIFGSSLASTTLHYTGSQDAVFGGSFEAFGITFTGTVSSAGGVHLSGGNSARIHDLAVSGFTGPGVSIEGPDPAHDITLTEVYRVTSTANTGDGIKVWGTGGSINTNIHDNRVTGNGGWGINADGDPSNQIGALTVRNNVVQSNSLGGQRFEAVLGGIFDSETINANSGTFPVSMGNTYPVTITMTGGYTLATSNATYCVDIGPIANIQGVVIEPYSLASGCTYFAVPRGNPITIMASRFSINTWDLTKLLGVVNWCGFVPRGCMTWAVGSTTVSGSGTMTPGANYSASYNGQVATEAPPTFINAVTLASSTGGTFLTATTYYFAVSWVDANGNESPTSGLNGVAADSLAIASGTNTNQVTVTWFGTNDTRAAGGYKVYGGACANISCLKLASTVTQGTFTLTMTAPPTGALPPNNVTNFGAQLAGTDGGGTFVSNAGICLGCVSNAPSGTLRQKAATAVNSLPSCASATLGDRRMVNNATSKAPGATAVNGGNYTVPVTCIYDSGGPTYTWVID